MTNTTDESVRRIAKKQKRMLSLSGELLYVLDETTEYHGVSRRVEAALWADLCDEHGTETVRGLVEDYQRELDGADRLAEPKALEADL